MGYRKPTGPRIGRTAKRLYQAEAVLYSAFETASNELADVLSLPRSGADVYYEQTLPEAIYSFLEHYDSQAVRLAIDLWTAKNPPD